MNKPETDQTIGIVLLNLGGPQNLDDVEPFLFNLFSDRKIIRLGPWFMQKFIARRIARKRAPKSREAYSLIGGGSPLAGITTAQGEALRKELAPLGGFKVRTAMRYWQPMATETLARFAEEGIHRLVALTLYPHYSIATTGSSLDDLHKAAASLSADFDIVEIVSWPDQPEYIQCLADTVTEGMAKFDSDKVQLVYSAHSLPVKFIDEGDPYLEHLNKTITALEEKTGIQGRLCFQSRSGPVEWLSPSTPDMLEELAQADCRNVLMMPISFVSDHVETLYEIDIQYRELAESLGIRLERTEAMNTLPRFISGLRKLVEEACRKENWLE